MTNSHDDEPVLTPLRDDYKATPEDRARVLTKLRAAALSRAASAPEPAAPVLSSRRVPWRLVLPSCALLALLGVAQYRSGGASSNDGAAAPLSRGAPSGEALEQAVSAHGSPEPATNAPAAAEPSAGVGVGVDALPAAGPPRLPGPSRGTRAPSPPSPSPASPAPPIATTRETVASPPVDTLEEETRLLGEAARAVHSGDGARALALVEEHARRFPRGQLVDERDVQRVLALCSLGETESATRSAQRFLAGRASSSLTRRVEQSCIRR